MCFLFWFSAVAVEEVDTTVESVAAMAEVVVAAAETLTPADQVLANKYSNLINDYARSVYLSFSLRQKCMLRSWLLLVMISA
jgi:hypothetical protein